jgi:hypothetical protein
MNGWSGKVVLVLVAALVVWNIYRGATVQEIGVPGFTMKFGPKSGTQTDSGNSVSPPPPLEQALAGPWRYQMTSKVSGNRYDGALDLTATGNVVSGGMDNPDPTKKGEKSPVQGNVVNDTLTLRRDTNQSGIVQEYRLRRSGDGGFAGSFVNVGITSGPYQDAGEFRIFR